MGKVFRFVPLLFVIFSLSAYSVCFAQIGLAGNTGRSDMKSSGGSSNKSRGGGKPKPKYGSTKIRTVVKTNIIDNTPTTGSIAVATESNAKIIIEPIPGGKDSEAEEGTVLPNEKQFMFYGLKPGRYSVQAGLEGFISEEQEVIVERNKTTPLTLILQPVTYDVKIKTNIGNGEVRYAPIEKTINALGEEIYNPVTDGEVCIVQIKNGVAELRNLRERLYGIDIYSGELGYEKIKREKFELPGSTEYEVNFNKIKSEARFSATFVTDEWIAPANWKIGGSKMTTNGKGVALLSNELNRYYVDFQIVSNAVLLDGVAASFVVRAVDKSNYYLIQITGKEASEPYILSGIVVKGGEPTRFQTIPISNRASIIEKGRPFKIFITVVGNSFSVELWDDVEALPAPLGILKDPYNTFQMGAPGIAAIFDKQKTEIQTFQVCTPKCPPQ
jgi:hypothetical protein